MTLKSVKRWIRYELIPWFVPAIPVASGAAVCLVAWGFWNIGFVSGWQTHTQIIGLFLSAGALTLSAVDAGIKGPHTVFIEWVKRFPKMKTGIPDFCEEAQSTGGAVVSGNHGGARLLAYDDFKNWVHIKIPYLEEEIRQLNNEIEVLESNIKHLADANQNEIQRRHKILESSIKKVSTSNFYQVLAGLFLLSVGSIFS